jgi:hypothetical protein
MRTLETDLVVTSDGRANVLRIPPGIRGGKYHAVLVIDDEPLANATVKTKSRAPSVNIAFAENMGSVPLYSFCTPGSFTKSAQDNAACSQAHNFSL